jgi:ParB family chromosome partitioning protein
LSIKDLSGITSKRATSKNIKQNTKDTDILNVERDMSESFGHKIEIDTKNKKAGKVSIFYKTLDELDSIIQKLKK